VSLPVKTEASGSATSHVTRSHHQRMTNVWFDKCNKACNEQAPVNRVRSTMWTLPHAEQVPLTQLWRGELDAVLMVIICDALLTMCD
jgi:hypothetical protein